MEIIERTLNGITVLDLNGDLARKENSQFKKGVTAIISKGARNLLLNLASVAHMDSSGLGELISCYKIIGEAGGRMKLLSPNHRLQNLFGITKLDTLFETFDSEPAAVASYANTRMVESEAP